MAKTENKSFRDSIIDNFIIHDNGLETRGSFKTYKMLNDLIVDYVNSGATDGMNEDARIEFFYRFKMISEIIYNLDLLAAEKAHNIEIPVRYLIL